MPPPTSVRSKAKALCGSATVTTGELGQSGMRPAWLIALKPADQRGQHVHLCPAADAGRSGDVAGMRVELECESDRGRRRLEPWNRALKQQLVAHDVVTGEPHGVADQSGERTPRILAFGAEKREKLQWLSRLDAALGAVAVSRAASGLGALR
ncbi:MAG: hypothetical protein EPN43_09380 [Jatrophihabitans sp.]|nr:MAG: hypothetical protein EPN43_09380 [Jatrophihabitans sp.]